MKPRITLSRPSGDALYESLDACMADYQMLFRAREHASIDIMFGNVTIIWSDDLGSVKNKIQLRRMVDNLARIHVADHAPKSRIILPN